VESRNLYKRAPCISNQNVMLVYFKSGDHQFRTSNLVWNPCELVIGLRLGLASTSRITSRVWPVHLNNRCQPGSFNFCSMRIIIRKKVPAASE
jgi:hypothetical protein